MLAWEARVIPEAEAGLARARENRARQQKAALHQSRILARISEAGLARALDRARENARQLKALQPKMNAQRQEKETKLKGNLQKQRVRALRATRMAYSRSAKNRRGNKPKWTERGISVAIGRKRIMVAL